MMTTDEILQRHGLVRDDIAHFYPHGEYEGKPVVCDCRRCEGDYAFVRDVIGENEWQYVLHSTGYEIIAYYPSPGVYLVKRKVDKPKLIPVTRITEWTYGGANFVTTWEEEAQHAK